MAKHPRGSTSQGVPSPKKVRGRSEAEVLTQMPEVVLPGVEEQEEEEEEEEEAVPSLHSHGLRSRGPAILVEGEHVGEPSWLKGSNSLKLTWWRGMMLRFWESQLSLDPLQPKREGRRCNSLGLPAC